MNTLITDKKYTLILSAYRDDNSNLYNLILTERMFHFLEHECHVHAIRAIGCYRSTVEQSFVVHTNSANVMAQIRRYAFDECNQECILVSHNRHHDIKLHNQDGTNSLIGKRFNHTNYVPRTTYDYTILNGADYYTVT